MFNFRSRPNDGGEQARQIYFDYLKQRFGKVRLYDKHERGDDIVRDLERVFVRLQIIGKYERPSSHQAFRQMMDESLRRRRDFFSADDSTGAVEDAPDNFSSERHLVDPDELLRAGTVVV